MTRKNPTSKIRSPNRPAAAEAKAPRASVKAHSSGKHTPKPAIAPNAKRATKAQVVPTAPKPAAPSRDSKQAQLVASLRHAPGITMGQMMALTGWQAHSVRGVISGVLRKKLGLNVVLTKVDGDHRYRIEPAAIR